MSFINKILTQAHRKRSHLQNRFLKNRCSVNRVINKQRNYCISFSRKSKKECHANLNKKDVADNKKFWKNKSSIFFLTKLNPRKSCIRRNDKIRTQDIKIADELNSFFFFKSCDLLRKSMDWFLYHIGLRHERVKDILSLHESSKNLFKWFSDNEMNSGKCDLILNIDDSTEIQVGEFLIKVARVVNLKLVFMD